VLRDPVHPVSCRAAITALVVGLPALIAAIRELVKIIRAGISLKTRRAALALVVALLALAAVGAAGFILGSRWSSREIPESPRAEILSPASGSSVPALVAVRGIAAGIPEGSRVWLVVNPVNEPGWWPQGGPLVPLPPSRTWQQTASLGGAVGQRFQVAVVLASASASLEFERYLEQGTRTGNYAAQPLPAGTMPLVAVEVVKAGS